MYRRGKPKTPWNIPRSITFSPLPFMFYLGKSIVALGQCVAMWISPCLPIPSVRWQLSGTTWMFGTPHTFISTDHVAEFTFFLTLYPLLSFLPLCRSSKSFTHHLVFHSTLSHIQNYTSSQIICGDYCKHYCQTKVLISYILVIIKIMPK